MTTSSHFPFPIPTYPPPPYGGAVQADGISSANTVGYRSKPLNNFQFVGSTFTGVGGSETMTYGNLKTNCDLTGELGTGWLAMSDAVVELNENGSFVRYVVYVPAYIAGEYGAEAGWYEMDAVTIDEDYSTPLGQSITFQPSEAFQVSAMVGGDATVSFRSALAE